MIRFKAVCRYCDGDPCVCHLRPGTVPVGLVVAAAGWTLRKRAGDLVDATAQVLFAGLSTALVYTLYLVVSGR